MQDVPKHKNSKNILYNIKNILNIYKILQYTKTYQIYPKNLQIYTEK